MDSKNINVQKKKKDPGQLLYISQTCCGDDTCLLLSHVGICSSETTCPVSVQMILQRQCPRIYLEPWNRFQKSCSFGQ